MTTAQIIQANTEALAPVTREEISFILRGGKGQQKATEEQVMSIWRNIRLFIGRPVKVGFGQCALCKKYGEMIDLGEGDKVHHQCWKDYVPFYARKQPREKA